MPRTSNTVNRDELHPEGVAGNPTATNPHEADPEPNTQEAAVKASRNRVNPDLIVDNFQVVGDLPDNIPQRGRGAAGRPMNDNTLAALRFLRQNKGKWVATARYPKPSAPGGRLAYAGYFVDDEGNPVDPTEDEEKTTRPEDFPVKKKIEYKYGPQEDGGAMLYLRLGDTDWTPPKKRPPKDTPTTSVNTTTDTEPSEANA